MCFDVEIAVAIAGHEVVLEIDLHDEPLIGSELLAERFARSGEFTRRFVEAVGRSQITTDRE